MLVLKVISELNQGMVQCSSEWGNLCLLFLLFLIVRENAVSILKSVP